MTIKAYTYEAATHCIACTVARHHAGKFEVRTDGPERDAVDQNNLPFGLVDREGNRIGAVDSWDISHADEQGHSPRVACDTCGATIVEAWPPPSP